MDLPLLLAQASPEPALPPGTTGYGMQLLRSLLSLAAVCVAAWWVLRFAARRGFVSPAGRVLQVREQLALDARRSLVLVKAGKRHLLVGVSDAGMQLLTELRAEDLPPEEPPAEKAKEREKGAFASLLAGLAPRPRGEEAPRASGEGPPREGDGGATL